MANLASLLKSEITRLARREVKAQIDQVRKASSTHRRDIAALKRQVALLSRQVKSASAERRVATKKGTDATPTRFVAKGLKSLRTRLDLSAEAFAKLAGVSGQSVYNWENRKSIPGPAQRAVLVSLRSLGKREAHTRLEQMALAARKGKKR